MHLHLRGERWEAAQLVSAIHLAALPGFCGYLTQGLAADVLQCDVHAADGCGGGAAGAHVGHGAEDAVPDGPDV